MLWVSCSLGENDLLPFDTVNWTLEQFYMSYLIKYLMDNITCFGPSYFNQRVQTKTEK